MSELSGPPHDVKIGRGFMRLPGQLDDRTIGFRGVTCRVVIVARAVA